MSTHSNSTSRSGVPPPQQIIDQFVTPLINPLKQNIYQPKPIIHSPSEQSDYSRFQNISNLTELDNSLLDLYAAGLLAQTYKNSEKLINFFNYSGFLTNPATNGTNVFSCDLNTSLLSSMNGVVPSFQTNNFDTFPNVTNYGFLLNEPCGADLDDSFGLHKINEKFNNLHNENEEEYEEEEEEEDDDEYYDEEINQINLEYFKTKRDVEHRQAYDPLDEVMLKAYEEEENLVLEIEKVQNKELLSVMAQEAKLTKQLSVEKLIHMQHQQYQKFKSKNGQARRRSVETPQSERDNESFKDNEWPGDELEAAEIDLARTPGSGRALQMQEKLLSMNRKP